MLTLFVKFINFTFFTLYSAPVCSVVLKINKLSKNGSAVVLLKPDEITFL